MIVAAPAAPKRAPDDLFTRKELDPDFIAFNSENRRYHFPLRAYLPSRGYFAQYDLLLRSNTTSELVVLALNWLGPSIGIPPMGSLNSLHKISDWLHKLESAATLWTVWGQGHSHSYVSNGPTMKVDPLGMQEKGDEKLSECAECIICLYGGPVADPRGAGFHHSTIYIRDCAQDVYQIDAQPSSKVNDAGFDGKVSVTVAKVAAGFPASKRTCKEFSCQVCTCVKKVAQAINGRYDYSFSTVGGINSNSPPGWILWTCGTGLEKHVHLGGDVLIPWFVKPSGDLIPPNQGTGITLPKY